jgi:hypothetical protein
VYTTHLDELVPTGRDDDGVLGVGGKAHAGDPLGVALVGDGVLAVAKRVPKLDGPVARAGDDLAVVGGEGDGKDIVGVADEAAGGDAGGELPETQSLVPRGREGVGAVRGDDLCALSAQRPRLRLARPAQLLASRCDKKDVRSRRRYGSGRAGSSWGSRTRSRRGSGSR